MDYTLSRCTRRCAVSDRPLEPGERYYSIVRQTGDDFTRQDIAESAWEGLPEGAIASWRSVMPIGVVTKLKPAPDSVLVETLRSMCDSPDQPTLAYLLGLLLVRRRILVEAPHAESGPADDTILHLIHPADETEFMVPVAWPQPSSLLAWQEKLNQLLYCEA